MNALQLVQWESMVLQYIIPEVFLTPVTVQTVMATAMNALTVESTIDVLPVLLETTSVIFQVLSLMDNAWGN